MFFEKKFKRYLGKISQFEFMCYYLFIAYDPVRYAENQGCLLYFCRKKPQYCTGIVQHTKKSINVTFLHYQNEQIQPYDNFNRCRKALDKIQIPP